MNKYLFQLLTKRMLIREFQSKDAQGFFEMNNDPEVLRYTGDKSFPSVEKAREFIDNYNVYEDWGFGRWTLIDRSTKEYIGFCGFKRNEEEMIDLGFRLKKMYWGQGLATEAAIACLQFGFEQLGFNEVIGRAAKKNLASIQVLKKIGMKYWKDGSCGDIEDSVYYKIDKRFFFTNRPEVSVNK